MREWHPSRRTQDAVQLRASQLADQLPAFLSRFDTATEQDRTFGGPSLYFHYKCVAGFRHLPVAEKVADVTFLEYLYATLASWGMHRMGRTATKLRNFSHFVAEISAGSASLSELESFKLWSINEPEQATVLAVLESVVESMHLSRSEAQLVANSKVVHHILPDLMPPIDRSYTLAFFGLDNTLPSTYSGKSILRVIFPHFAQVARMQTEAILSRVDLRTENWHTSPTKVIDNAIIGALS